MTATTNEQNSAMLTSPSRLRKIDLLREKNIGKYLPLPQLVAVGDQSSGKSSLLESLTGIPFPHGQELCTRYATQITHRRDELQRIDVSIIPGPHASEGHAERLKLYRRQVESDEQLYTEFPTILDEVNAEMGIRTKANPGNSRTFSDDVLKIEKCGPKEDYLTVIDVPGIFRATAEDTTPADRDMVKNMVKEYIRDDRTIILAVLPSNVDVATQEILDLAKQYDKTGDRTLGVLTKPDTLTERNQKQSVCNLVLGTRMPLTLGYYIVRNRGGDDDGNPANAAVAQREEMFRHDLWRSLPRERIGVAALRERLQELLGQITDRAFPKLLIEAHAMRKEAEKALAELGPSRQTEREQQVYLMSIAGKFQQFVRDALDANYSYDDAFARDELRLITAVLNITEQFKQDFDNASHSHRFHNPTAARSDDPEASAPVGVTSPASHSETTAANDNDDLESGSTAQGGSLLETYPELKDIIVTDWTIEQPVDDVMEWIGQMRRRSRGVELGTFGPAMLASAFREQSRKWGPMTEQYISKVILAVHKFFLGALEFACPDARVRERLTPMILHELLDGYREGMKHALFLVAVEREKRPYTLNSVFNISLQTFRGRRVAAALAGKVRNEITGKYGTSQKLVVDYENIETAVRDRSNDEHEKENIHDILSVYYDLARDRFIDNIWHQAVDHVLLSGPTSPLGLFSEQWVIGLSTEKLDAVAGEPRGVTDRRDALQKKIRDLKEAMDVLR
ncbi:P-loop containing nucleoside triphosphate hydrolase protein [Diplogelasinospora grovesii]|uniref:P-loop containing nucleoside triphosphate hydrolase protein n=1 Tax=Diplogelasinospora grovesii TaxID=303347 RepID=A0AAN6N0I2_9PEZI|nr:P-loop containing nucleoside triphosphate hydrolase protein [Diplogelasinospora grovesii]